MGRSILQGKLVLDPRNPPPVSWLYRELIALWDSISWAPVLHSEGPQNSNNGFAELLGTMMSSAKKWHGQHSSTNQRVQLEFHSGYIIPSPSMKQQRGQK